MIMEEQTYLQPGTAAEAQTRFGVALTGYETRSDLLAVWRAASGIVIKQDNILVMSVALPPPH